MKNKSLKKLEKEKYREEIIKNERYNALKIIDDWADIVWDDDTITPRDCVGSETIEILKSKFSVSNQR